MRPGTGTWLTFVAPVLMVVVVEGPVLSLSGVKERGRKEEREGEREGGGEKGGKERGREGEREGKREEGRREGGKEREGGGEWYAAIVECTHQIYNIILK